MSPLAQFLQGDAKLDPKVVYYMIETLQLRSISDFANFWPRAEYETGVQSVVSQVPGFQDLSQPASRLQVARLRAAWKQAQARADPREVDRPDATATLVVEAASSEVIGIGWTSPEVTTSTLDGLWGALEHKVRNPQKFMDVSNVVVADRPGFTARSMTINATSKPTREHIYAHERKGEMIFRLVAPETKRELQDERVIAVKENPLRMEFFHRHASDGCRTYWQAPVDSVKHLVQELVDYAEKAEGKSEVVGLGICGEEIQGVSHDAVWRSMMASIREPARFFPCSDVEIQECEGFVQRSMTTNGSTYVENIYTAEAACTITYRKLINGSETDIERVLALRTHPLQIEFHQRSNADGFRVQWDMPRSAPWSCAEALAREAKRMDGARPSTIGYGITSDPIRDCSPRFLFAAVELSIQEPWRVLDVDQRGCIVEHCRGYMQRKMKLSSTGETIVEQITVNDETSEVTFSKHDASGKPGDIQRVLAIHTPPRLEFYERSASSGRRVNWRAPYDVASSAFTNIVKLARRLEGNLTETISFGLASKPITGVSEDALWKAMLYAMRNPAECGLKVDNVKVRYLGGFMQRTMRLQEPPGRPTVTDNVRVIEGAQEITYRPVVNNREAEEERVFALRADPLRFEMFCRHPQDEMRMDWQAPRSIALAIFRATIAVSQRI